MFIKNLKDCSEFISADGAALRELANARTQNFQFTYSLAHAVVKPGTKTKLHELRTSEVYYIMEGKGKMHINDEAADVGPGCMVNIPPQAKQCIENTGDTDLVFLCIVEPAWKAEDEKVLE
ncbi:MAG: cupin domain-containing protein [Candidatus Omnitrophica bacterium]|nr:cupin domain-containing protein [Candidatus Omnitrophota bacterium]